MFFGPSLGEQKQQQKPPQTPSLFSFDARGMEAKRWSCCCRRSPYSYLPNLNILDLEISVKYFHSPVLYLTNLFEPASVDNKYLITEYTKLSSTNHYGRLCLTQHVHLRQDFSFTAIIMADFIAMKD